MRPSTTLVFALFLTLAPRGAYADGSGCAVGGAPATHRGCLTVDDKGAHLTEDGLAPSASPLLDVTVGGHRAFSVDGGGMKFAEPGDGARAAITLDLTNPATNNKHGISGALYTDNATSQINSNLLALDIYTPPDNGGEVSGAYIRQTGGGNALSVFNLCGERPKRAAAYCSSGFAIEAQVDGSKHSIFASAVDGSAFLGVVRGASGAGLSILPERDDLPGARAIHVTDAGNTQEKFFVDMAGHTYARELIRAEGGVQATNSHQGNPVFQAFVSGQSGFFASVEARNAVGFHAKPGFEAGAGGSAFRVDDVAGKTTAAISMAGAASFRSLSVGGAQVSGTLSAQTERLGGAALANGACAKTSVTVIGANTTMAVVVSPAGGVDPGDGFYLRGLVTDDDAVTVKLCNAAGGRATPAVAAYNVRVLR